MSMGSGFTIRMSYLTFYLVFLFNVFKNLSGTRNWSVYDVNSDDPFGLVIDHKRKLGK